MGKYNNLKKCISNILIVSYFQMHLLDLPVFEVDPELATTCSYSRELRCSEVERQQPMGLSKDEARTTRFVFAFDKRAATKLEARLSM